MKHIGIKDIRKDSDGFIIVTDQEMICTGDESSVGGKLWWRYILRTVFHNVCDSDITFDGCIITVRKHDKPAGLCGAGPVIHIDINPEDLAKKLVRFQNIA